MTLKKKSTEGLIDNFKTTLKAHGFLGVGGGSPCAVDYKNGKIIR